MRPGNRLLAFAAWIFLNRDLKEKRLTEGLKVRGAKVRAAKKLADVMARLDRAIQEQKTHIFQYGLDGRVGARP